MKLNSINSLLAATLILLLSAIILFWIQISQAPDPVAVVGTTDTETKAEVIEQNGSKNSDPSENLINTSSSEPSNNNEKTRVTSFLKDDQSKQNVSAHNPFVNFSDYITDKEQIAEIREITSREFEGLEIEELDNGIQRVDLKKRWSTVHVTIVDENGERHTGEWAPNKEE